MKLFLLGILLFISLKAVSQDFSIGVNIGYLPNRYCNINTYSAAIEFRPYKSIISINYDPIICTTRGGAFLSPLYLKAIFGKELRFCPFFGGFINAENSYGLLSGLILEYKINERVLVSLKTDCISGLKKSEDDSRFGTKNGYCDKCTSIMLSVGIKRTFSNKPATSKSYSKPSHVFSSINKTISKLVNI